MPDILLKTGKKEVKEHYLLVKTSKKEYYLPIPKVCMRGHMGFILDRRLFATLHIRLSSSTAPSVIRKIIGNALRVFDNISIACPIKRLIFSIRYKKRLNLPAA